MYKILSHMIHARRFIIIVIIIIITIFIIIIIINVIVIIMPSLWHHHYHHCHHHSYKFKKINTFLPSCILCTFWLFLFWANNDIIIYRMKIMWTVEIQIVNARYDCCRTSTGFEPMASALALQCSINWNLYFHSSHHRHSVGKTILQHQQFVESLAELSELIRPVVGVDGYIFPVIP